MVIKMITEIQKNIINKLGVMPIIDTVEQIEKRVSFLYDYLKQRAQMVMS